MTSSAATPPTPRRAAARRWPPIVAAIAGAILVFLVLPNPLNVPQQNPSSSAEYAPVPGKQQEAQSANFATTNTASSSGIGDGGDGVGALPGSLPPPLPEFKPRQKACVGNPPRQTEDPLSPPCVPFFEGDNGGATFQGVTKDDIKIIFYADRCCEGDMNAPWKPSDENACSSTAPYECDNIVRTVKAQLRFFQRRYQTYGRTVRVTAHNSSGNVGGSCASRQGDAQQHLREDKPFAVVVFAEGNTECYMREMAENGVPVFGNGFEAPAALYEELRPYGFGFFPTQEVQVSWSASFICERLRGETAKYARDITYQNQKRTFGFIRPEGDSRGPELRVDSDLLQAELKRQCGMTFDLVRTFDATAAAGAGSREAANIISEFKRHPITTVVCYCIPVQTELTAPTMLRAASLAQYSPEWFWDPASAMDRPIWLQTYGNSSDQNSFGITYFWRNPAFREQFHYQAYLQEEPGSQPNVRFNFSIYHLYLNLFQGIQAAGPTLTPETVEQGMFTFNWLDRSNPWVPVGGYGPYNADAVSNYTFIDTAMAWWWDPTGTPPGGQQREGCQRVINNGERAYVGGWPKGDAGLRSADWPCSQDNRKLTDPGGSTGV